MVNIVKTGQLKITLSVDRQLDVIKRQGNILLNTEKTNDPFACLYRNVTHSAILQKRRVECMHKDYT